MLGLKRGTVELYPHDAQWKAAARDTIALLRETLGDAATDIQHVGSTAIDCISAKPIIDIAVGVATLDAIKPYIAALEHKDIIYRKEDVADQLLFVIGDFENDTRTHHIHVVQCNGPAWNNYLNFRDYLNAFPDRAKEYDALKKTLAAEYSANRNAYTAGKQELIDKLLKEACLWRSGSLL